MQRKPKALYVAMTSEGAILRSADGDVYANTAKGELQDFVNDIHDEPFEVWRFTPTAVVYKSPRRK